MLFSQKAPSYVWNGSEYASTSLENNLSSKKESGSHNNHYENVYDEDCFFSQSVGKIWKFQKSLRQEINDFQHYDRPFPRNACGQFVLISGIL